VHPYNTVLVNNQRDASSFYMVYYHSTCFGRGSRPSSGVILQKLYWQPLVRVICVGWSSSIPCGMCMLSLGMPWVGRPCGLCSVVVLLLYTISLRSCLSLCCCCTVVCGLRGYIRNGRIYFIGCLCVWVIEWVRGVG